MVDFYRTAEKGLGTGRRAGLRILCLLQACGVKSRLTYDKKEAPSPKTRCLQSLFNIHNHFQCQLPLVLASK